ncbi:MAG: hypothetical protein CMG57_06435 [Candidatus Marinimicrobia bacterium]|nr:hypothetical protein [Candidatus Neomarinimicrobiota bacterium]
MKKISLISMLTLILFSGCTDQNQINIETTLLALLDSDDVLGMDGFDTNGDVELDFETGLEISGIAKTFSDTLAYGEGYRIRFGRRITDRNRTVDFDVDGDTAVGLVTYSLNGILYVKAFDTTVHTQIDSISFTKEFSTSFIRKVRFNQVDNPNSPEGYDWKVNALTPLVGGSGHKVAISSISIYELTTTMEQGELLYQFNADGIGDLFIDREALPNFTAFMPYLIEVSVTNSGPELNSDSTGVGEWVLKNYGRSFEMRGRRHLNDKGMFLDSVINDNIHTGGWRAHGPGFGFQQRGFRSFFETVDLATIFVDDGGYNTSVWSIPYRIQRP